MRRILIPLITVLFLVNNSSQMRVTVAAQGETLPPSEPDSGSVVCPPGVYEPAMDGCLALGPSEYLAQIAATGIPYPIPPLPGYQPAADLNDIPYKYFKVTDKGAPLYATVEDAANNQPSDHIAPGYELYVSYVGVETDRNGTSYYRLRSGDLIGMEGGRQAIPVFQGLAFSSQPARAFGWVMDMTTARSAPGLKSPESSSTFYRFNIVQIYDTKEASNLTWNLVGPNEWLEFTRSGAGGPAYQRSGRGDWQPLDRGQFIRTNIIRI